MAGKDEFEKWLNDERANLQGQSTKAFVWRIIKKYREFKKKKVVK